MLRWFVGCLFLSSLYTLGNAVAQEKSEPPAKQVEPPTKQVEPPAKEDAQAADLQAYEAFKRHLTANAVKRAEENGFSSMELKRIARLGPGLVKLTMLRVDPNTGDSLLVSFYFTLYDRSWTVSRMEWSTNTRDIDRLRLEHQLRTLIAELEIGQ